MSDTPEIAPALTPDEWKQYRDPAYLADRGGLAAVAEGMIAKGEYRKLAALLLHLDGGEDGFTAEDVATCSIAAAMIRDEFGPTASEPEASQLRSLAARIAALLPPEGTP